MMTKPITIAGKPLSRFYKLPFGKGSRVLKLEVLEAHSTFRKRRNAHLLAQQSLSFSRGLLTVNLKPEKEETVRVYIWVTYDYLLVSCSVDTDETYLGRYAYHTLRAMMWEGCCDFQEYYWPECFVGETERSKFVEVVKKPHGLKIRLKKKFRGFFRPGDDFPDIRERVVVLRSKAVEEGSVTNLSPVNVGYCFANTDLLRFHSNHYAFLIPYVFSATAYLKTVKSYRCFVFNAQDVAGISLSPQQQELNSICFAMKRIAAIRFAPYGASPETLAEIKSINAAHQQEIFRLWNRALPLLRQQAFTHYFYTYGLRNVVGKPFRKDMELAVFSLDVPVLSFVLRDKGDYYELQLKVKVNGKLLDVCCDRLGLFLVCDRFKPHLWYLLEAEMDCRLVWFFSRVGFRVQVPKGYYKEAFEGVVEGVKRWYGVEGV